MKKVLCIALLFGISVVFSCQSLSQRIVEDTKFIDLPKFYTIQVIDSSVENKGKSYVKIKIEEEQFLISPSYLRDITALLKRHSVRIGISIKTGEVAGWSARLT